MFSGNVMNKFMHSDNHWTELCHQRFDGKKAILNYPPKWVTIGITGNCGFQCEYCCSHCPKSGENEKTNHQYKMTFNIKLDDYKRIVDLCYEAGVPRIHICGTGEPFMHPHILEIIDYLISIYSHVSLQTDFWGKLFEKKNYINEIIKRKKHITYITTDIFPKKIHDSIKRGSNFEYLLYCMERISRETGIVFGAHVILSKQSYIGLTELLQTLHNRKINFYLNLVHLAPLGFNEFTSQENVYMSSDIEITKELQRLKKTASRLNQKIVIPPPYDKANINGSRCPMFWTKVQIMPSKKLDKTRWCGNAIPQQCSAVVGGNIFSVGNLFDYKHFMDFWNNEILVKYRKKIMAGKLPDEACKYCHIGIHGKFKKTNIKEKIANFIPNNLYRLLKYGNYIA